MKDEDMKALPPGEHSGKSTSLKFELESYGQQIGRALKETLPNEVAFFLILSNYGENGTMVYTSSVARAEATKLLREMADKLEKG